MNGRRRWRRDGAVSEAGINFAMGKPCALYKSDSRGIFGGPNGSVHPALQMAGHLFKPVCDYKDIYDNLARQSSFINSKGAKYSNKIHPLVEKVYTKGHKLNGSLQRMYTGHARKGNPWFWYRVIRTEQDNVELAVGTEEITVPRDILEFANSRPAKWAVVERSSGSISLLTRWGKRYAVCPSCRQRQAPKGRPGSMRCNKCNALFEVAWETPFIVGGSRSS